MNKQGMLAAAAVLALAYPAANWFIGTRIESMRAAQNAAARAQASKQVEIVKSEFTRGIYRSEEVTTVRLSPALLAANAQGSAADTSPPQQPVDLTFRTAYRHGPLAGLTPALAVADTELVFSQEIGEQLAKLFGGNKPLIAHTVLHFDGGGVTHLGSPSFNYKTSTADGDVAMEWGGLEAELSFTADVSTFTMRGAAPRLVTTTGPRGAVTITDVSVDADGRRAFPDNPYFYVGAQRFKVGRIEITPGSGDAAVTMGDLAYAVDVPMNGDFVDFVARVGVSSLAVGQKRFGPVRYELSLHHLSAQKVSRLYEDLMKTYANGVPSPADDQAARLAPLVDAASELLQDNPEFRLDRLSISMNNEEAVLSGRAKLDGATRDDLAEPARLMAKLDAGAELAMPEKLLDTVISSTAKSPDEAEVHRARLSQQVEMAVKQGFVERDGAVLKTKATFARGTLLINGTPVPWGPPAAQRP